MGEATDRSDARAHVIDAHVHIWGPDSETYPWDADFGVAVGEPEPVSNLLDNLESARFTRALIVQSSVYGCDHRYLVQVLTSYSDRFRGVALVDPLNPLTPTLMHDFAEGGMITGIRMTPLRVDRGWFSEDAAPIWEAAAQEGLALTILVGPQHLEELGRWARRYSEVKIILDHFACPDISMGKPPRSINGLIGLAEIPNCHMKMSALGALSAKSYPFSDMWDLVRRAVDAFGATRILWGSDFPYVQYYGSSIAESCNAAQLALGQFSRAECEAIMGGNTERIFRFSSHIASRDTQL